LGGVMFFVATLLDPPLEPPSKKNNAIYTPQICTPNSSETPPPSLVGPTRRRRRRRRSWQELREMREASFAQTRHSLDICFSVEWLKSAPEGQGGWRFFFFLNFFLNNNFN
jgi:hypothetical protein